MGRVLITKAQRIHQFWKKSSVALVLLATLTSAGCVAVSEEQTQPQASESSTQAIDRSTPEVALVVIAYLQVKPDQRETFIELATTTGEKTNSLEEGAISYAFYEDPSVENLFFFFEEWKSREAFESHLEQPHTKALVGKYPELLERPADIKIYGIDSFEETQFPE
ncbi:MAG: antibiotic biosynthesis monooxygenase [Cyanobacteria bacterium SID2]|nr:antibiotic biosynthesis monooxygenase [Cyanobacteria bacterium SID2]MBP0003179.1 antibiotic biosynthesis monooxygenase [Cyanobacteria bacterium SBC]